jgi:hypothetical protein
LGQAVLAPHFLIHSLDLLVLVLVFATLFVAVQQLLLIVLLVDAASFSLCCAFFLPSSVSNPFGISALFLSNCGIEQ